MSSTATTSTTTFDTSAPTTVLEFIKSCYDCAQRTVTLPPRLPEIGDDFDWQQRDYDSFRLAMLEELAGRFPERSRWTPADIEVILVEAMAVALDQISDGLDRAYSEAFLETARRPDSVKRLLAFIGYDAVREHFKPSWNNISLIKHLLAYKSHDIETINFGLDLTRAGNIKKLLVWLGYDENLLGVAPSIKNSETEHKLLKRMGYNVETLREALDLDIPDHRLFATHQLYQSWYNQPHLMNAAKKLGPASVNTNKRMVSLSDYQERLEDHPLVLRAAANQQWTGSWSTLQVVNVLYDNGKLNEIIEDVVTSEDLASLQSNINDFHWLNELPNIDWQLKPSFRSVIKSYLDRYRMIGQEVWLIDSTAVGINIGLSIRVNKNFFQSEVRQAVNEALSSHPGGFFEPGLLKFGEDLYASNLVEHLMQLDGVEAICLNRFKRVGARYADQSGEGVISLRGYEIARCDNDLSQPSLGFWSVKLHGGQLG